MTKHSPFRYFKTSPEIIRLAVMHMGELLQQIEAKGAGLVILSLGSETVDTTTATGKLIDGICRTV